MIISAECDHCGIPVRGDELYPSNAADLCPVCGLEDEVQYLERGAESIEGHIAAYQEKLNEAYEELAKLRSELATARKKQETRPGMAGDPRPKIGG